MPLLRLRSDEQLVALFRAGNDEAFRVIHDRYRKRLFAYTRQMLPGSRQDAEDALQDVFVKAYAGLRTDDRELALRAWLYRVAHNRCIDQLRRAHPIVATVRDVRGTDEFDPIAAAEQRETLRRLIADVQRLPAQQRSALLMRELSGMSYVELATALGVSVSAVKSLLVRARLGLAAALEARETSCLTIREELVHCHDRGVRPNGTARRHLRDCPGCRDFRRSVRGVSRNFAALTPALGPLGFVVKVIGGGGAGAAGTGSAVGTGGAVATSGAAVTTGGAAMTTGGAAMTTGGAIAGGFAASTAGHVATLLAAAIVTAGGAVAVQPILTHSSAPVTHRAISTPAPTSVISHPSSTGAPAAQTPVSGAATSSGPARLVALDDPTKPAGAGAAKKHSGATGTGNTGGLAGAGGTDGITPNSGSAEPGLPGTGSVTGTGLTAGGSASGTTSSGTDPAAGTSSTSPSGTGSTGSTDPSSSPGTTGSSTGSTTGSQTGTQTNSGGASSSPGTAWGSTGGSGTYSESTGTS